MASRKRNRVLGIAALVVAAAAAVVIVLLSQSGNSTQVKPLREETAKHTRRGDRSYEPSPGGAAWADTADSSSRRSARRAARKRSRAGAGTPKHGGRPRGRRTAKRRGGKHELPRPARSKDGRPPRGPIPPAPAAPTPVSVPAPPSAPAPAAPPPTRQGGAQPGDTQPGDEPVTATTPRSPAFEIGIDDGELEGEHHHVRSADGHFRLLVRSDELVIVEVEGRALSQVIVAGGEALIEFDSPSTRKYELELRRRKGVLKLLLERD